MTDREALFMAYGMLKGRGYDSDFNAIAVIEKHLFGEAAQKEEWQIQENAKKKIEDEGKN